MAQRLHPLHKRIRTDPFFLVTRQLLNPIWRSRNHLDPDAKNVKGNPEMRGGSFSTVT